jgi:molybdenum transport protein
VVFVPDADLDRLIAEDCPFGDPTISAIGIGDMPAVMRFFAEHRVPLPSLDAQTMIGRLRESVRERKIVVEVGDVAQALDFARAGADVLQLENFPPEQVAQVVANLQAVPNRPIVVAAGGVNTANAADYAAAPGDVQVTIGPDDNR